MIDEGAPADLDEFRAGDPYDLDLPDGWSAQYRDRTAVYENGRGDHRVRIVEFSKGLSLYWWVDVYVGDEEWHRQEVGLGDSYTDPEVAVAAVESYLEVVADSEADPAAGADGERNAPSARDRVGVGSGDSRLPRPGGWRLEDAVAAVEADANDLDDRDGAENESDADGVGDELDADGAEAVDDPATPERGERVGADDE